MQLTSRELQQIDAAILAHSKWITQLKVAILDGSSKFDPDIVMSDNHCDFGKWLYEDFPKPTENGEIFEQIRNIHATFHQNAASILRLAAKGDRQTALDMLMINSEFIGLSSNLIQLLKALRAGPTRPEALVPPEPPLRGQQGI